MSHSASPGVDSARLPPFVSPGVAPTTPPTERAVAGLRVETVRRTALRLAHAENTWGPRPAPPISEGWEHPAPAYRLDAVGDDPSHVMLLARVLPGPLEICWRGRGAIPQHARRIMPPWTETEHPWARDTGWEDIDGNLSCGPDVTRDVVAQGIRAHRAIRGDGLGAGLHGHVAACGPTELHRAVWAGRRVRVSFAYIEPGNVLVGQRPDGRAFAVVGYDTLGASLAVIREVLPSASEVFVRAAIAHDLGMDEAQVIFVEQTAYHVDLQLALGRDGELLADAPWDSFSLMYAASLQTDVFAATGTDPRSEAFCGITPAEAQSSLVREILEFRFREEPEEGDAPEGDAPQEPSGERLCEPLRRYVELETERLRRLEGRAEAANEVMDRVVAQLREYGLTVHQVPGHFPGGLLNEAAGPVPFSAAQCGAAANFLNGITVARDGVSEVWVAGHTDTRGRRWDLLSAAYEASLRGIGYPAHLLHALPSHDAGWFLENEAGVRCATRPVIPDEESEPWLSAFTL